MTKTSLRRKPYCRKREIYRAILESCCCRTFKFFWL